MPRQVIALALPALVQQFFLFVIQQYDQYLARTFTADHQAALTTANYLYWFVSSYSVIVGAGATALVGRFFGAKDFPLANRAAGQAVLLAAGFGLLGTIAGLLFIPDLTRVLQLPGTSLDIAVQYLTPLVCILPLQMIETAGIACFVGAGDTRTGPIVLAGVAAVNVPVAYGLSRGVYPLPDLGFVGIAFGTAAAHATGGLVVLTLLARGRSGLKLTLPNLVPNRDLIRRLLRVSVPAAADSLSVALCQFWFLALVNRLGAEPAAAHGIALRWEGLGYLSGAAFGSAAMAIVSQNLGALQPARAARGGWAAYALGGGVMTAMGAIFFALASPMCDLYSPGNETVAALGVVALRTIAFVMPFLAASIIFTSALRAAGDTRIPVLFTWLGFLGIRIPLGYLLTGPTVGWGLFGAWLAMSTDIVVRGGLFAARFAGGRWKKVTV
jgi:putative MATE family efflux protein